VGEFKRVAPTEFSAFLEFDKTVGRGGGAIPRRYRELIAIAVACTTQRPSCRDLHTRAARAAGATREEVMEGRCWRPRYERGPLLPMALLQ
jgi:AhpD family alkylhydroperoxidase